MKAKCSEIGMKPVCDHPSYCGRDTGAVYIGQSHHIAHPPHRNINSYFPSGWSAIKSSWDGLCSYTANANGNNALCNIPSNTHAWRNPAQANPGFMCAKAATFSATLAAKNGAKGGLFDFAISKLAARNGKYSDRMVEQCKKLGMKPVCDHPSYCKNDKAAVYLGQTGHLAYKPHRNNDGYMPTGFSDIRGKWDSLCSYTNNANGNNALCNIPTNTHAWRNPGQYNPGFVCGKPGSFMAKLGAKNGVKAATYEFTIGSLLARGGKYSDRMVDSCKQYGMKPVCDHPNYCKTDAKAIYIGQSGHIAYAPHRNNNGYMPSGFKAIASKWSNLCSYTNNANGNYALCNIPSNTHAWRHPGQYNPGFVCGKVAGGCTAYQVANSNYAKKSSITGSKGTSVTVKCSSGFTGGGKVTCGSNGKFTTTTCKKASSCGSTKVANSNKKGGTGKGTSDKSVTVTCDKGFTGGGKLLCSKTKWSWDTGGVCKKASAKKCPGDADGNKKVNIEDLLELLGTYSKTGSGLKADFDGNKKVDIEDLLILLGKYGTKC